MSKLTVGSTAPAFTLSDPDGKQVSLSDFASEKVILYFFPAAMTPGCTVEAIDFSAAFNSLDAAGYRVIGVSPDTPEKLAEFRDKHDVSFLMLSDPGRTALGAYGAYGKKVLYGKTFEGVIRSTFVIQLDNTGVGLIRLAQYNVRATGHVERLCRELGIMP